MEKMKAVGLYQHLPITDPASLQDIFIDRPVPTEHDLLVEVRAISVNPIDTKIRQRQPQTTESYPKILGWDVAGVIREVGDAVTGFKPGDAVFYAGSHTRAGANSEYHVVDARLVSLMPSSLTFAEAAALPLTSITAAEALFERVGLAMDAEQNRGKTILIIGAAGGMGSVAIQLAKLAGLTVIGTASRAESQAWCQKYGADHVLNHHQPLAKQLQAIGLEAVDLIFSLYRTDAYWEQIAEIIAPQGKICALVDHLGPVDLNVLKSKSVTFVWEFMFTRPLFQTKDLAKQGKWLQRLAEWVDKGKIQTTVNEKLSPINAKNVRLAHQKIESGKTIGKIVLTGFEESQ